MSSTLFNERLSAQQPARPVCARPSAVVDRTIVHVTSDTVVKQHPAQPRDGTGGSRTRLRVEAWVRDTSYEKSVWLDVHVFDRHTALMHSETVPLHFAYATGAGGDIFVYDGLVCHGAIDASSTVGAGSDARALAYRLYCEMDACLVTDGVVHWCDVRADSASDVGGMEPVEGPGAEVPSIAAPPQGPHAG